MFRYGISENLLSQTVGYTQQTLSRSVNRGAPLLFLVILFRGLHNLFVRLELTGGPQKFTKIWLQLNLHAFL